jgi:hypothetical protein
MLHSRSAFRNDDLNPREVQYPVTRQALSRIQKPSRITSRVGSGAGAVRQCLHARFQPPPVEPCMRFSRTRLTDVVHRRHSA